MKDYPRIIFFGTPEFAVASLEGLINEGYNIAGVVTAPDKPAGRGRHTKSSPVRQYALEKGLHLMQPGNLKDPGFLKELKDLGPDLQVVVAFRMLPVEVWSLPPLGTFNLHASLLPSYRGAAPINWAIINGEKETGVTTFFINDKIDTGNIISFRSTIIEPEETAGELHDRLMKSGADLVTETVSAIAGHKVTAIPQEKLMPPEQEIRKAPKIYHDQCRINWDDKVANIHNFIRGLSPQPGAFTFFTSADGKTQYIKVYKSIPEYKIHSLNTGQIITDHKTYLKVAASDGFIHISEIQPAGRKTLSIADFLRGAGRNIS